MLPGHRAALTAGTVKRYARPLETRVGLPGELPGAAPRSTAVGCGDDERASSSTAGPGADDVNLAEVDRRWESW